MPTAENALLRYEGGQQVAAMSALTDSGDHIKFTSTASLWSQRSGYAPVIRPNGLLTGGAVSPHATDNTVSVAALTLNLNGVVTAVNAGTRTVTRGATAVVKVNSITANAAGSSTTVIDADLTLTKTDNPDPVAVGGALTYTLTVGNLGSDPFPSSATLTIREVMPAGLSGCSYRSSKIDQAFLFGIVLNKQRP